VTINRELPLSSVWRLFCFDSSAHVAVVSLRLLRCLSSFRNALQMAELRDNVERTEALSTRKEDQWRKEVQDLQQV